MKNFDFKKWLPHLIALGVFLLVSVIFCKTALESGVVMKQADISGWEGMSQQSSIYLKAHGHPPLWVTSMFSGMPAYQVMIQGAWTPLSYIDHALQLWLPKPMNFFFLSCICFYFLCICLRIRPYAAIFGALAFTFCSFSTIMVSAGHDTQILALAYAPAVMGAVVLIFDKKYLAGVSLATLFTALQIAAGHQQISYYLFIVLIIMSIAYIIRGVKAGQTNTLIKSLSLLALAGIIGVAVNAVSLFPAYDYAKASKRGGQLVMDNGEKRTEKIVDGKTTGLSKEYAFQWSYGKAETMTLMFPGIMGYGFHYAERDNDPYMFPLLKDDSHVVSYMAEQFPQAPADQIAQQMSQSLYWGDQPFTNGPVYLGAIVCMLFIFGMFYLDGRHKWWILAASVLGVLLAWGSNFDVFNSFMFNHFPLYNKFRVPTMALAIPQLLVPILAALTLDRLWDDKGEEAWKKFKYGMMVTGAVFAIALAFYASSDFSNENKQRTKAFNDLMSAPSADMQDKYNELNAKYEPKKDNSVYESWIMNLRQSPDAQKVSRGILTELRRDRAAYFMKDILMSLLFVLIGAALIVLYLKRKIGILLMTGLISFFTLVDLLILDTKYLNEKNYDNKENYEASEFPQTDADRMILQDKDPNYRVFNMAVSSPFEESKTSYYHKSIGGYHAAKMGIYDDLSTYQMGSRPNPQVLNMLNAKYIIRSAEGGKTMAIRNPDALGNAWFVKGLKFVNGPVEEMKALYELNTKDSAVAETIFKDQVTAFSPADSSSSIMMTSFDNDAISYESKSNANNLAVFSEIYYKDWKAYIDGKPASYIKVNYVLRAMVIPAGTHKIDFKFEPEIFFISKKIGGIASWIMTILLLVALASVFITRKKKENV